MKKITSFLIRHTNILKWIFGILAIILLIIRFIYGRKYEIDINSKFTLSTNGILLASIGSIFCLICIIFYVIDKDQKSRDSNQS